MNIHMYHQFSHVDLRGMYNGFLIPLWPRAAPRACGLSDSFNGLRWIILVGLFPPSDMNKTSISSLWGYFSPFVCWSLLLAHLVVISCMCMCVCVRTGVWQIYSHRWLLCEKPQRVDHWLLHLILGKSKCEKSHLKQYLHHQVGSRMFMKAVCHITCNLWKMNCYFLLFYAPRRGRKCQNYLALHLCRNTSTWRIRAWTRSMSLCPRSLGEMRNLCVVYSPSINTPHNLWSLTPL